MGSAFHRRRRRAGLLAVGVIVGLVALAISQVRNRDSNGAMQRTGMLASAGYLSPSSSCCCPYVKPLPFVAKRDDIGRLLEEEGMAVGVELGVQRGLYAEILLNQWTKCKKFILVRVRQMCEYVGGLAA